MKFRLTPERRAELEPVLSELDAWVQELEELELGEYEPTLDWAHLFGAGDPDAKAD